MVFTRMLPLAIISGILIAGCEKKEQPALNRHHESPKAASAQDTGKVFGKYFNHAAESTATANSVRTFSMNKPAGQPPVALTSKKAAEKPAAEALAAGVQGSPEFSTNGNFVVQVACAATSDDADAIAGKFKKKGYPAYVLEVTNPASGMEGTYYRVRIGCFRTRANAIAFGEQFVKPENFDFWVDYKSNETPASPLPPASDAFHSSYNPLDLKAPVPAAGNPPHAAKTVAPDIRIWDTATSSGVSSKSSGSKPAVSGNKASIMRSPLDVLLKVYDTGSAGTTAAPAKKGSAPAVKKDSTSMIPTFVPPATPASGPSGGGPKGNK